MAAPTIKQIRAALAVNLETIPNVQVSAYMLLNPTAPTIEILPDVITYDETMHRGMDDLRFILRAYAGVTTDRGAQILIDSMLEPTGSKSVKAATESDPTLGGIIDDLRVVSASGYRFFEVPGKGILLGCDWTVEIFAPGA